MSKAFFGLAVILTNLLLFSCTKKEKVEQLQCQLEAVGEKINNDNISIIYTIEGEGSYEIESWIFLAPEGEIKTHPLKLPISDTVSFTGQIVPKTTAKVRVNDGWVRISFKAQAGESVFSGSDKCEQHIYP